MNKQQIIDSAVESICELDFDNDNFYVNIYHIINSVVESTQDNLRHDMINLFDKHRKA